MDGMVHESKDGIRIRLRHRRLAAELAQRRLSQNAWAVRLGVSKAYLSQMVNGRKVYPSPQVRHRLLEALQLEFDELFEWESRPARPAALKKEPWLDWRCRMPRFQLRLQVQPTQASRGERAMNSFTQDVRHGLRQLARKPAFAIVALLTLAVGIGANSAIFSAIQAVLLAPLPYPDPERIVRVDESNAQRGWDRFGVSPLNYLDWRQQSQSFEHMAVFDVRDFNYTTGTQAERVEGVIASSEFFDVLGVKPALGRTFTAEEDRPGQDRLAVISHSFWQGMLGGQETALGGAITLDGTPHTVIGIMPAGFAFPSADVRVWRPASVDPGPDERGGRSLAALARLKADVPLEQADAEIKGIARQLAQAYPDTNQGWSATLTPIHELMVMDVRRPLIMLWTATALVLLIACANLANLMLSRASSRQKELAIRMALGAGRKRLVRQLLTESLLLSILGGAMGLLLAAWCVRILPQWSSGLLPRASEIQISPAVLAFTAGLSLLTGLLFGLLPAWKASGDHPEEALKEGGRGSSGSSGRLRRGLIVAEVALALSVLFGAGLLLRSFVNLLAVNPGFDAENLLALRVEPPMQAVSEREMQAFIRKFRQEREQMYGFYGRLLERIESLPGVRSATAVNRAPLAGNWWNTSFSTAGRTQQQSELPNALSRVVMPGYFRTLGISLLSGRTLRPEDSASTPYAVVIDESLARLNWPGEDPIGQRITMQSPEEEGAIWYTVVGVVGSVAYRQLESGSAATLYFPLSQSTFGHYGDWGMDLMVRSQSDPSLVADSVRQAVQAMDPDLPAFSVRSGAQMLERSWAQRRFHLVLLGGLASVALLLAAVGIYGVISYSVTQRSHEIGVRRALGAQSGHVLGQVVREGMSPVLLGLLLGVGGAWALSRLFDELLFQVQPSDPLTFALVATVLCLVGAAACLIPARRAARVDPLVALRYE